jgi:hypothetical protein
MAKLMHGLYLNRLRETRSSMCYAILETSNCTHGCRMNLQLCSKKIVQSKFQKIAEVREEKGWTLCMQGIAIHGDCLAAWRVKFLHLSAACLPATPTHTVHTC